ncbi:MAG: FliM/FliN family flagellar motor C-terminal domain-containing protein [Planctomycetota bacterium]
MAGLVDPEEAAAIAHAVREVDGDSERRHGVVVPRDFAEPRTLSSDRIARIRKTISSRLHPIVNALAGPLRGHPSVTLGDVGEVNAQSLFDGFVRPFLVHGFICGGQQCWILWDPEAARVACDTILSGPEEPAEPDDAAAQASEPERADRPLMLTRTERRVVGAMLDVFVREIAGSFGLDCEPGVIWQEPEELTTLEDLGPDADTRRLFVHLTFDDERGATSNLRIYLPGVADVDEENDDASAREAPAHLGAVQMDVAAILGGADVPLSELLAVEIGDVIPLEARVGDSVDLVVEETLCARGRFGSHDGLLAVRIEEIDTNPPHTPSKD